MTTDALSAPTGAVYGQPRLWLRLEALTVVFITMDAYRVGGYSWVLFAALFLVPDVTFVGYLAGTRIGAICYNCAHSYVMPVVFAIPLHFLLHRSMAVPLIWVAHIGFDRLLGYGLKYSTGFNQTHLGRLGREMAQSGVTSE